MKPTNQDTVNFISRLSGVFSEAFNGFVFGAALIAPVIVLAILYQWLI